MDLQAKADSKPPSKVASKPPSKAASKPPSKAAKPASKTAVVDLEITTGIVDLDPAHSEAIMIWDDPRFAGLKRTQRRSQKHGGHFAGAVVSLRPKLRHVSKHKAPEKELVVLAHKTFHRYTSAFSSGVADQ